MADSITGTFPSLAIINDTPHPRAAPATFPSSSPAPLLRLGQFLLPTQYNIIDSVRRLAYNCQRCGLFHLASEVSLKHISLGHR